MHWDDSFNVNVIVEHNDDYNDNNNNKQQYCWMDGLDMWISHVR